MAISTFMALIALLLCYSNFTPAAASTFGFLDRLRASPISQRPIGAQNADAHELSSTAEEPWNVMQHQGGNSPWFQKTQGIIEGGIEPPAGCRIDQVHMISRHAERYPTMLAGIRMLELYQHLQKANVTLQGDLAFANDWDFFMADPAQRFENLVPTGPYAGTLEALKTGVKLRTRYENLLQQARDKNQTSFWASDSTRVIETAKYFAAGFFSVNWKDEATLHVIPETRERGGDTLTPGKSCRKYLDNVDEHGREYGIRMLYDWRDTYLPPIIERLAKQNPDITFTDAEVYSMQELCGFETIAKGSSKWCDVFTREECESFEYARDLLHYYRTGAGNPYSGAMGWLWLNATASLLREGPEKVGPLFFSFVHDGDILPLISAMDLFPQTPHLPNNHILHNRHFRTSDVVSMGGRIIFERLACPLQPCYDNSEYGYPNHVYCLPPEDAYYVRVNVNDGIVALPGCDGGPGSSCPLEEFEARVQRRGREVRDFKDVCGLEDGAAEGIAFLHQ